MEDMYKINIPPEALEAGRKAFANAGTAEDDRDPFAEACLAMLKAWPRMDTGPNIYGRQNAIIHLPLPTENPDDKA